jgi:hypothetical protein
VWGLGDTTNNQTKSFSLLEYDDPKENGNKLDLNGMGLLGNYLSYGLLIISTRKSFEQVGL